MPFLMLRKKFTKQFHDHIFKFKELLRMRWQRCEPKTCSHSNYAANIFFLNTYFGDIHRLIYKESLPSVNVFVNIWMPYKAEN